MAADEKQGRYEAYMHDGVYQNGSVEINDHQADPEDDGYLFMRSRQDCDDLIALLERVRERLPKK